MPSKLFSPLTLRAVEIRNRIFVSPMCQYSAVEGVANDWHRVHLASRAVGGAGLVLVEATAVTPAGRITPADLGIWNAVQAEALSGLAALIGSQGAVPGIQLAHAGRKACTTPPWLGGRPIREGADCWETVAPSAIPFGPDYSTPHELSRPEIDLLVQQFGDAARTAWQAGFKAVEIHMAHGYLLHEFLSPLSNHRLDGLGGDLEGRLQVPLRVVQAVRKQWPEDLPLFVRISATDWIDGGWDLPQSIVLAQRLRQLGVDLVDCSSGGLVPTAKVPAAPGYQIPFAATIRREAGMATGAVGLIQDALQAEQTLVCEEADAIFIGRALLRDPYWPLHAAETLRADIPWPVQYQRAKR
jgi:2,4-dienoyl-CoA reductase-like NADH-dependent reductase (Old Yellow Enzyme family)